MKIVPLDRYPCLRQEPAIGILNRLVRHQQVLQPHQLAAATGCDVQEAMNVLVALYAESLATSQILVYHIGGMHDPPVPIAVRELLDGPPSLPIWCDECGREIEQKAELAYDFLFTFTDNIQFVH